MIRYQDFLSEAWVPEYGSAEDPKQFEVLYKYSPYQHVDKGAKYPAVLFVTGDSDTRVAPLHARKNGGADAGVDSFGAADSSALRHQAGHSAGLR